MKEELIALGKVLQCDFEDLVNQQLVGWLTNDFLMNADLQPLTELEAELSAFWEINDQFALLETSLTSGFIPGESSEKLGTGIFTQHGVHLATANTSQHFEVKNPAQGERRSPSPLPELTSFSKSLTSLTNDEEVKNQTQSQRRSPSSLTELTSFSKSLTSIANDEEVKNQTQSQRRSPSSLTELTSFSKSLTSIANDEEVKNQTQSQRRSPSSLTELTSVSESPTVKNQTQGLRELAAIVDSSTSLTNNEEVKNQTQSQRRSPSQLPELTSVSESPTVKNQTQAQKRSPLGLRELVAIVDSFTSTQDEEVKNQTQAEKRSPLGLKELANFLASEPYSNDSDSVNSQATPAIETSRQPDIPRPSLSSAIETASTTAFSSQNSGYWEEIEAQNRVLRSNLISKSIIEADDSSFESEGVVGYPASSQTVQHLKPFTSQQISKGNVLSESSFSQEQHQQNYSQENPTTKHETNFFAQPLDQKIEIDLIFEAISQQINREYRRFYGC